MKMPLLLAVARLLLTVALAQKVPSFARLLALASILDSCLIISEICALEKKSAEVAASASHTTLISRAHCILFT